MSAANCSSRLGVATLGGAASSTVAGALALDARGPHNSDDSQTSGLPRMIEFSGRRLGILSAVCRRCGKLPAITAIVLKGRTNRGCT